ncbi:uncharacterized protein J3R85_014307 [Psidium guajava]|nr:uncharacterized protein J3R85_014307 [Psidium guajava]
MDFLSSSPSQPPSLGPPPNSAMSTVSIHRSRHGNFHLRHPLPPPWLPQLAPTDSRPHLGPPRHGDDRFGG